MRNRKPRSGGDGNGRQRERPPVNSQQSQQSSSRQRQQQQSSTTDYSESRSGARSPPLAAQSNSNSQYSSYADTGDSGGPSEYPEDQGNIRQIQCPDCGRMFNEKPFKIHQRICAKVFKEKRKTFDSKNARLKSIAQDEPEIMKMQPNNRNNKGGGRGGGGGGRTGAGTGGTKKKSSAFSFDDAPVQGKDKGSKWKQESNAFREAMKASRQVTNAIKTGAPMPAAVNTGPDMSLVPCPHCDRRFNAKAADRHIPQCQNIKAKPKRLARGSGGAAVASRNTGGTGKRGVQF